MSQDIAWSAFAIFVCEIGAIVAWLASAAVVQKSSVVAPYTPKIPFRTIGGFRVEAEYTLPKRYTLSHWLK